MVTNWLPAMAAFCVVAGPALAPRTVSSGWTFHHARFELTLPEGWQVADFAPAGGKKLFVPLSDPSAAEHTEVVHFAHASGAYFTVFVDHGTEFEFDAIWEVKEGADGSIQIVREGEFCRPLAPETLCTFGNGSAGRRHLVRGIEAGRLVSANRPGVCGALAGAIGGRDGGLPYL